MYNYLQLNYIIAIMSEFINACDGRVTLNDLDRACLYVP